MTLFSTTIIARLSNPSSNPQNRTVPLNRPILHKRTARAPRPDPAIDRPRASDQERGRVAGGRVAEEVVRGAGLDAVVVRVDEDAGKVFLHDAQVAVFDEGEAVDGASGDGAFAGHAGVVDGVV